jgi:hypothetical protein
MPGELLDFLDARRASHRGKRKRELERKEKTVEERIERRERML